MRHPSVDVMKPGKWVDTTLVWIAFYEPSLSPTQTFKLHRQSVILLTDVPWSQESHFHTILGGFSLLDLQKSGI